MQSVKVKDLQKELPEFLLSYEQKIKYKEIGLLDLIRDSFITELPENYLWHYTNLDSFYKICETDSLRFSDYRFLNDKNEVQVQFNIIRTFVQGLISEKKLKPSLAKYLNHLFNNGFSRLFENAFICSFSEKRDSVMLWKSYANRHDGICLGFDFKDYDGQNPNFILGKVVYDDKEKFNIIGGSLS